MRLSTICTFGGVAALGAGAHLFSYGERGAALVLALAGLLALAFVGWAHEVSVPAWARPSRRIVTAAVAGLVVFSLFSGPAAAGLADCSVGDSSLLTTFVGAFVSGGSDYCLFDTSGDYSNQSHTDHYATALAQEQNNENFHTAAANYAQETRQIAWAEGKLAAVNELNDGGNASEIEAAMNASIDDYYAQHQKQIYTQLHTGAVVGEYIWNANESHVATVDGTTHNVSGFVTAEVKLIETNGSTMWVRFPVDSAGQVKFNPYMMTENFTNATGEYNASEITILTAPNYNANLVGTNVTTDMSQNPLYRNETGNLTDVGPAVDLLFDYRDQSDNLKGQSSAYATALATTYNQSELNVTDVLSPSEIAGRASSDYGSTGYYGFLAAELAAMGYSGDFNSSVAMNWTHNGTTESYEGTPFYTGEDVTSFEQNTTYNASDLNGTFILAAAGENGSGRFVEVDEGSFVLTSITDPNTGETLNSTDMESYDYNSTDVSDLEAELNRLSQALEAYQEQSAPGGGGGWNIDLGGTQVGVIAALLVVVLILSRD